MSVLKKLCKCCSEIKDVKYFPKNTSQKDGLHIYCKKCKNKKERERNYNKIIERLEREKRIKNIY